MVYPVGYQGAMLESGPGDPELVVPGGTLMFHPNRDKRFPYLYTIPRHSQVDKIRNKDAVKHIIVYIQDTDPLALRSTFEFEETLHVPLGPNNAINNLGLFNLQDGTIVYARAKGMKTDEKDTIVAWNYLGSRLNMDAVSDLLKLQEEILGDKEGLTTTLPHVADGKLQGGTRFERLGQKGVKGTRCYSLGLTHQSQRRIVGPTAGGKVYSGSLSENEQIRKRIVEISTGVAMDSLKTFSPPEFLEVMTKNSEANNIPKIGTSDNVAYPAVQLNIAPAVPYSECHTQGLQGMGEFGSTEGHRDNKDSEGGLTCMISISCLPSNYESGRFHLLGLGVYIISEPTMISNFCGLNSHGGSPPIAPEGEEVSQHAYRLMCVCYPPSSMLSNACPQVVPLASLPNGTLLALGPEITNPFKSFPGERYSNEACWTIDGAVVMNRFDHFQHVSRLTLQLIHYIFQQLPAEYNCQINSDKFFEAISIKAEEKSATGALLESSERLTAGTWAHAPDKTSSNMNIRRQNDMIWLEHCRQRAQFIPAKFNYNPVELPDQIDTTSRLKTSKGLKRRNPDDVSRKISNPKKRQKIHRLQEVVSNLSAIVMDSALCQQPPALVQAESDTDAAIRIEGIDRTDSTSTSDFLMQNSGDSNLANNSINVNDDIWSVNSIARFNKQMVEGESERGESVGECNEPSAVNFSGALSIADILLDSEDMTTEEEDGHLETGSERQNGIASFLKALNGDAVETAMRDYRKAWAIRNENHSLADLERATNVCRSAIQTVKMHPHSAEAASTIGGIWKSLDSVRKSQSLSKISAHATEAILMLSIYTMFTWIAQVVSEAMNATKPGVAPSNIAGSCWVINLVSDIRREIQQHHHGRPTRSGTRGMIATLHAHTYLSNLSNAPHFSFVIPRLHITNTTKMNNNVERIAINAIRTWMEFPTNSEAEVQSSLIASLMECGRVSILFLEPVRRMFQYPYRTVINGPNSGQRRSKPHTREVLSEFYYAFQGHDFMDPESTLYSRLQELEILISEFSILPNFSRSSSKQTSAQRQAPLIQNLPPTVNLSQGIQGKRRFVEFLEGCYPLAENELSLPPNSSDHILEKIADKPDFLLPFRSLAPTVSKARQTILADRTRLATREGLFNLLAFRGVFYGSPFAHDDIHWFHSYNDWLSFEEKHKSKGESYFVNKMAYGSAQSTRETENLKEYWERSTAWVNFQRDTPNLDLEELHTFFRKFRNIGNLTAMLMIGDLVESKFIPEPKANIIGRLVAKTKMGALRTLQELDLVKDSTSRTEADIVDAFVELDQYCRQMLDVEKRDVMRYSVVTLEHALCKYSRISRLRIGKAVQLTANHKKTRRKKGNITRKML